jgi:hypothetical protein
MTLDELKTAWRELDRKVTAAHTTVLQFQAEQKLDRARSALRPLVWKLGWELFEGIVAVVLCGWYLGHNYAETRFAVPGIVLHVLSILSVISTVWQLELVRRIDYSEPVVTIQKRLVELRALRVRTWYWVLILSPLLWILLLITTARGLLGADLYDGAGLPFVLANFGFGVAFLAVAVLVSKVWAARSPDSSWRSWMADGLAGGSLVRAREQVREAAQFQDEAQP